MRLAERLKEDGDFCFSYRSYLPLILIPLFIVAILTYCLLLYVDENGGGWNNFLVAAVLCFGLLGQGIRVLVAGFVPRGTSGRNTSGQIADSLNTTGLYSVCRNPLYLGNFFMILSPIILIGNWLFALCFILMFWLYYERIIYAEEAF